MSKKKISSQDFLNLMDEQDDAREKMAFNPKKKATPRKVKAKKQPEPLFGNYKLSPLQEEWLKFAVARTPKFVVDFVKSPAAQKLVAEVETRIGRLLR